MHTDEKRWTRVQTNSFSWKKNEDRRMCHRASRATVLRACSHARGIKRHADAQNRWRKTSSTFFCARRCRLRRSRSTNHPFPRSRFRPMITQSFVSFLLSVFLLGGFSLENGNRARSTSLFAPARTLHPSSDAQI